MKLSIKRNTNPVLYHCISANRTIIGGKKIEFICDKVIKISFDESHNGEKIFKYNLLGHKLEGSGLIHNWASDMESLQNILLLRTDDKGKIIAIENRKEIYNKWVNFFRDKMIRKYKNYGKGAEILAQQTTKLLEDDKAFLNSFYGYNLYRVFFQGHYAEVIDREEKYSIEKYFGEYDLPLILSSIFVENKDEDDFIQIKKSGELNKDEFNQDRFTRMIKDLTGVIDIDAKLKLEIEEIYTFNKKNWITNAELYLKTHAANMYALANAHSVKMIDIIEAENLIQSFTIEKINMR